MTDQQTALDTVEPAAAPAQPPARRRPRARAALRWGTALLVFGLSGAATAFAVTTPARTDLPGLHTPSDGRYAFPAPTLPPLPPGRPGPFANGNLGHHWAELKGLLLPAPRHALEVADPAPSPDATRDCAAYTALFSDAGTLDRVMTESACRRGAGRSWTMPDGTRTEIRLVGFGSQSEAAAFYAGVTTATLKALPDGVLGDDAEFRLPSRIDAWPQAQRSQGAGTPVDVARAVHLQAGDLVGTVLMTNPRGVSDTAFRQVVADQVALVD